MKTSDETLSEFDQFTLAYKLFMTYARMCVCVYAKYLSIRSPHIYGTKHVPSYVHTRRGLAWAWQILVRHPTRVVNTHSAVVFTMYLV